MNNDSNSQKAGIDLRFLLSDFRNVVRRIWLLALALMLLLSGLFALRGKLSYHPQYQASATFTVYVAAPLQSEVRGYNTETAEQMAKTFPYILTSGALKDMVERDLDLPVLPAISASVMDETNIFTLTVTDQDPQRAYDVLQSVMEHYPEVSEFVVGPTVMNLLDESGVPTAPSNPLRLGSMLERGALVGLGLWLALALLLTFLRSTIHSEEELKRCLNLRCLGSIPLVKSVQRGKRERCPMVEEQTGSLGFAESIRLLRVRVEKALRGKEGSTLLISSATPGEGKTTVAINLAKSLAMKGKRVLLVDCDLRNPSVGRNLGCEGRQGLADFLEGRIAPQEALSPTALPHLYVAFAGTPQGNPPDLLAKPEAKQWIETLKGSFDYTILDTPPAALLADAAEIADAADAALMVIRQNYASRTQIIEGAQLLADSGAELIGCAMNYTTKQALSGYGGYYGYGYGHYGHYGTYGQ